MEGLYRHIIRYSGRYSLLVGIMLIYLCFSLKPKPFEAAFDNLGMYKNEYIANLEYIHQNYGDRPKILLEIEPKSATLSRAFQDIQGLETELKEYFDTVKMNNLTKILPFSYTAQKLEELPIEEVLDSLAKNKLLADLIAKDRQSFLVPIELSAASSSYLVQSLQAAIDNALIREHNHIRITSHYHIEQSIQDHVQQDVVRIICAIICLFIGILLFAFRHVFALGYTLLVIGISVLVAYSIFQRADVSLNLITIILFPIIIVLSAADAIHLLTAFHKHNREQSNRDAAILQVYRRYFIPSLLTSLTTAVALLSLSFNTTSSIRSLAWIAALSILLNFVLCFIISPFLLGFCPNSKVTVQRHFFYRVAHFFMLNKRFWSFILLLIFIISILLLPRLSFKSDYEIFMPRNNIVQEDHDTIKEQFYSQANLDLILFPDSPLDKQRLISRIERIPSVQHVIHYDMESPLYSSALFKLDLFKLSGYQKQFKSKSGEYRMQLRVDDPNKIQVIATSLRDILKDYNLSYKMTSPVLVFNTINAEVASALVRSLLSSCLFLIVIFALLSRSLIKTAIGFMVNIVPVSAIVLLFVGFDLHLNIMSSMIAVICLGLMVDDTIHSFYRKLILQVPLDELKFSMFTTTSLLAAGFLSFVISSLIPIRVFGAVSAFIFLITLIADYTLLLYLIELFSKKKQDGTN